MSYYLLFLGIRSLDFVVFDLDCLLVDLPLVCGGTCTVASNADSNADLELSIFFELRLKSSIFFTTVDSIPLMAVVALLAALLASSEVVLVMTLARLGTGNGRM